MWSYKQMKWERMTVIAAYSRIAAAASGLSNFAKVFTYSSVFLYTL